MSQDATSDASDVTSASATEADGTTQAAQAPDQTAPVPERQPDSSGRSSKPSSDEDQLGESGKRALVSERQARRDAERQLGELQARLQEFEDRDKTELQKAIERAEAAEKGASGMRSANARLMAAATHNIPPDLIDFLGSGTDEEINARAEALAERLKAATPPAPPASQRPVESLTPGAAPSSAATADPDAWIRRMAGR